MKIVFVIPHYWRYTEGAQFDSLRTRDPASRVRALERTILSLHQSLGLYQRSLNLVSSQLNIANAISAHQIDILICTNGRDHLLDRVAIPPQCFHHAPLDVPDPLLLGFQCRKLLKERLGAYDYYCYLEDDISIHDPYFFHKLAWFTGSVDPSALLMPNRYERVADNDGAGKCYIDGDNRDAVNESLISASLWGLDFRFIHPPVNPHAGCYFLNEGQMAYWAGLEEFDNWDTSFFSALDSAATLSILKTFTLYKPAWENAAFLEVEHFGDSYSQSFKARL